MLAGCTPAPQPQPQSQPQPSERYRQGVFRHEGGYSGGSVHAAQCQGPRGQNHQLRRDRRVPQSARPQRPVRRRGPRIRLAGGLPQPGICQEQSVLRRPDRTLRQPHRQSQIQAGRQGVHRWRPTTGRIISTAASRDTTRSCGKPSPARARSRPWSCTI